MFEVPAPRRLLRDTNDLRTEEARVNDMYTPLWHDDYVI